MPPELSPTLIPAAVTPTPAAAPVLEPTAAAAPETITEDIIFSGALSVEDLNTLMLGIRALPGVDDVQGGMQDLLITYEPKQVTRQKIIETIKSFGYTVKE